MSIRKKLEQEIKVALKENETLHSIAKGAGVEYSVLYKFYIGTDSIKRNIRIETADKLCKFFDLELVNKRK